jgi:hypothetical protein
MSSLAGSVRAIFQANEKARTAATGGWADPRVASANLSADLPGFAGRLVALAPVKRADRPRLHSRRLGAGRKRATAHGGYLGVSKVRRANVPVTLRTVGVDRALVDAGPPI